MIRMPKTLGAALAALAVIAGLSVGTLQAQQSSLRAQQVVAFRTGQVVNLPLKVGPVVFASVEFSNLGRNGRSISGMLRSAGSSSEASTTVRGHFLAENPTAEEWDVTIVLEFLDRAGKVIERVTRKPSWEGEAKPYDFDTDILEYVVPMIAQVRITLEARVG